MLGWRKDSGYDDYANFWINPTTGILVFMWDDGPTQRNIDSDNDVRDGQWHHVVVTQDGVTVKMYIDDNLQTDTESTSMWWQDMTYSTQSIWIGDAFNTGTMFNGLIDEVRIYNIALTPGQINEDMNSAYPVVRPVASWSFEGITAGQVLDTHNIVKGRSGAAISFDGGDDYVQIMNEPQFDITEEHTLAAWIKVTETFNDQLIVGKGNGYILNVFGTNRGAGVGKLEFWSFGTVPNGLISDSRVDDGNWHHIAGVYDGTDRKIYIDGLSDKTPLATTGLLAQDSIPAIIGSWCSGTCRFTNGLVDEVIIYDRALSASEVAALAGQ